ncbi:hypothetical protein [Selenomonas ruminantium]|uniref:Uncharacterized protein n=1 Tax=Selenomonas ruminantium TaxID=971 RepID=A0A1H0P5S3_SELRU|nr:hypothetical protein [Selenomonas ruminantium]SDP00040.1 hypothetical protein SAMN05216366_104113 [Selenomonas ruminantium]
MFEFDIKALLWLAIGAGGTLMALLMLSLCSVAGKCSRLEEQAENQLRVKNWNKTPERLAMTERKRMR